MLFVDDAPATLVGMEIDANGGRGVWAVDHLTLDGVEIHSATGDPCAVEARYGLRMRDSVVRDNDCAFAPMELATNFDNPIVVTNSEIRDNAGQSTGGMSLEGGDVRIVIEDSRFVGNRSDDDAGALLILPGDARVRIRDNTFCSNVAFDRGGAVDIIGYGSRDLRLVGNTFVGNTAQRGGAVHGTDLSYYVNDPTVVNVARSVFYGNAADEGAAFAGDAASGTLRFQGVNLIIAGQTGAGEALEGRPVTLEHSLVHDNAGGHGVSVGGTIVEADPLLANPTLDCASFDPALLPGSPGIDAGSPRLPADADGSPSDIGVR